MKPVVRVTQQGFTHCPSCSQFIKITESASQTVCPFCEAPLRESVKARPAEFGSKLKLFGRGALLAGALMGASVLSASVLTACDTEETEETEEMEEEDVFNPRNSQSDYGGGGFEEDDPDLGPDPDPEPAYRFVLLEDNTDPVSGEFPGNDVDAISVIKAGGGEVFATRVVDFNVGDPNGNNSATDPNQMVGAPDANCQAQSGKFTALGGSAAGGFVIVEFRTNGVDVAIENGDSIKIYELGATLCGMFDDDAGTVSISTSSDLGTFIEIGTTGAGQYTIPVAGLP